MDRYLYLIFKRQVKLNEHQSKTNPTEGFHYIYWQFYWQLQTRCHDLLMEFSSIDETGEPRQGYIEKVKNADGLLYYWQNEGEGIMFKAATLDKEWCKQKFEWLREYEMKPVTTDGAIKYAYLSIAVPLSVLKDPGVRFKRIKLDRTKPAE
jgi:hypothetical protein